MTIYASTPVINDDPAPFRIRNTDLPEHERSMYADFDDPAWSDRENFADWAPRPEFDRPRAHEANRILVAFRERETPGGHTHIFAIKQWLAFIEAGWDSSICPANWFELNHAHRVLSRWLAVFA